MITRREFIAASATAAAVSAATHAFAAPTDGDIKIALIGCGGRGTGAASQNLTVSSGIKLVAMADIARDRLESSLRNLKAKHPNQVEVPTENQFIGFDAYKDAMKLADLVLIASPQGFHPYHLAEAVQQGKHVFVEKPLAVDAPGVRRVLAAAEEAKKKNLKIGVGLQRRHQPSYQQTVERLHAGAVGEITSMTCYWLGNSRAGVKRLPEENELQYQLRNWYYFTWLSGDFIVDQHIHNIDIMNWIKRGHPIRAQGMGGRQVRNDKALHGQIFDHHFVEFEYADGTTLSSQCRQGQPGSHQKVSEHVVGTLGRADLNVQSKLFRITGPNAWELRLRQGEDGHQLEHYPLIDAIRNDKPFNDLETAAMSTMTAIMGRMATYSGRLVEWDEAMKSDIQLMPEKVTWDMAPPVTPDADGNYPVAVPGRTKAV